MYEQVTRHTHTLYFDPPVPFESNDGTAIYSIDYHPDGKIMFSVTWAHLESPEATNWNMDRGYIEALKIRGKPSTDPDTPSDVDMLQVIGLWDRYKSIPDGVTEVIGVSQETAIDPVYIEDAIF